jgi:hypothetical protein
MTQALHTPPVCEKHGCEQVWQRNKALKAGGQWRCKECSSLQRSRWKKANPDRSEQLIKDWRKANPEKTSAYCDTWRQKNLEKEQARDRARAKANAPFYAAKESRRRAVKRNATVPGQPVTAAVIAERFALFDGCAYCGADKKLEIEHVAPLAGGGLHVAFNLVGACRSCNASKNDKPVEQWFRSQPFFSVERWERLNGLTCA